MTRAENLRNRSLFVPIVVVALLAALGAFTVARLRVHPSVALVGDSITEVTGSTLHRRLDDQWDVAIVGIPGATVDQLSGSVDAVTALHPRQVVVNEGTNDILQGRPVAATLDALRTQLDAFGGVSCVHVVTVSESMFPSAGHDVTGPARQLNAGIRALAAERGAHVVDWAGMVHAADASGVGLTVDSVHPDDEGQRRLADAYADTLASCSA